MTGQGDEAAIARVELLLELRRYAEADAAARALLVSDPHSATAYRLLGSALLGQGLAGAGAERARTACGLAPTDPRCWMVLSECCGTSGDHLASVEAAERAVELDPHLWATHYTLAHAHVRPRGFFGARAALDAIAEAQRLAPGVPEVHNIRGMALAVLDRVDEARSAYEEALRLDPHHGHALNNLGALDARTRPAQASERFTAAARIDPMNELYRRNLGIAVGNVLFRARYALMGVGVVATVARIAEVPLSGRVVVASLAVATYVGGLVVALRLLPRPVRRSPSDIRVLLGPTGWARIRISTLVLLFDLAIALAPSYGLFAAALAVLSFRILRKQLRR